MMSISDTDQAISGKILPAEPLNLLATTGLPGAPTLILQLLVESRTRTGFVVGMAQITQAIAPPDGIITVQSVTGQLVLLEYSPGTRLLHVSGKYRESFAAPAIGSIISTFEASFFLAPDGKSAGSYTYGDHKVEDVPAIVIER